jgi:methionyl-tRNA formyltransferase
VTVKDGKLYAACSDCDIEILELQPAGKKRLTTAEYLRGARLNEPKFV